MASRSDCSSIYGTLYSHLEPIDGMLVTASSDPASQFSCAFNASWSRWSRFPSVQRGRHRLPRGTPAICFNALLSSHVTEGLSFDTLNIKSLNLSGLKLDLAQSCVFYLPISKQTK